MFVQSSHTSLLIDVGVNPKRVFKALNLLGESSVKHVLLTHLHSDHYKFVPNMAQFGANVYGGIALESKVRGELKTAFKPASGDFYIDDILVSPFPVSHDVPCQGYSLYSFGSKVTVVTDLGRMPHSTLEQIADSDAVLIESNYDEELMRLNTKYPVHLKKRITGPTGHLSNVDAAECVSYLVGKGVKNILLGHLSENNNTPDIALATTENSLIKYNLHGKSSIAVALQDSVSEIIEI